MTLRRLALGTLLGAFNGRDAPGWTLDLAASGLAGYVLFARNVDGISALSAALHAVRPDLLIAIDEEGGDVTRLWSRSGSPYPGNAALGVADDQDLTRSIYGAIGSHLATAGVDLDLAPVVDVNTATDNPVIGTRSFGSSATLVARHAAAAVHGLQDAGVAACAKHFPGHGATTVDSHLSLPTVEATELAPFAAATAAGVRAVMTGHIRVPSLTGDAPATFSPAATRLLRSELGFRGVIVTDALEMRAATGYAGGTAAGAVLALAAGADLLCLGARVTSELIEDVVREIVAAVRDGRLAESRLAEAAARAGELAAWTAAARSTSIAAEPVESGDGIGLAAARRAIAVEGTVPDLSDALFVQLDARVTAAEGRAAWGLVPAIVAGMAVAATSASAADISSAAGARPIVIVGRNLHREPGARELIGALAGGHAVIVVEMGRPTSWRPDGVRAFVTTYGSSRANAQATYETLRPARTLR